MRTPFSKSVAIVRVKRTIAKVLKIEPMSGSLILNLSNQTWPASICIVRRTAKTAAKPMRSPTHQYCRNAPVVLISTCVGSGSATPKSVNIAANCGTTTIISTATAVMLSVNRIAG